MFFAIVRHAAIAIGLLLSPALPVSAAPADDLALCITADPDTADAAVKDACDRYLASGEGSAAEKSDAYFGRARARDAIGELEAAMEDLGRAIDLHPTAKVYVYRGQNHIGDDNLDAAMADLNTAIRDFDSADAYAIRGEQSFLDTEHEKAISDFNEALKRAPDNADALRLRAKSYTILGRTDEAIAALDALLQAYPNTGGALGDRADLYMKKGEVERAVAEYTAAITVSPKGSFYDRRAAAYVALKQYDKAIADQKVAVTQSPTSAASYIVLGNIYSAAGDAANAEATYKQAYAIAATALYAKTYPVNFSDRGDVFLALKRYNQALADYNSAIYNSPEPAYFYFRRADIYAAMGDTQRAEADRAKAKELDPRRYGDGALPATP